MKLPLPLAGVYRAGRMDSMSRVGIEPQWWRSTWKKVKKVAKRVLPIAKPLACMACGAIPNPAAQIACRGACAL